MSSKQNETGNHTCSSGLDKELMYTLENCHKNANERDSRRQILSIMADKVSLATIQQWIPGLTSYRFKVARQHDAVHGSGKLVPTNAQTKLFIPEAKLAHFLDFITSSHVIQDLPFGAKTITLSTNEVSKFQMWYRTWYLNESLASTKNILPSIISHPWVAVHC